MFAVLILFQAFIGLGKPSSLVPNFLLPPFLISGIFGEIVARYYSEPVPAKNSVRVEIIAFAKQRRVAHRNHPGRMPMSSD